MFVSTHSVAERAGGLAEDENVSVLDLFLQLRLEVCRHS